MGFEAYTHNHTKVITHNHAKRRLIPPLPVIGLPQKLANLTSAFWYLITWENSSYIHTPFSPLSYSQSKNAKRNQWRVNLLILYHKKTFVTGLLNIIYKIVKQDKTKTESRLQNREINNTTKLSPSQFEAPTRSHMRSTSLSYMHGIGFIGIHTHMT